MAPAGAGLRAAGAGGGAGGAGGRLVGLRVGELGLDSDARLEAGGPGRAHAPGELLDELQLGGEARGLALGVPLGSALLVGAPQGLEALALEVPRAALGLVLEAPELLAVLLALVLLLAVHLVPVELVVLAAPALRVLAPELLAERALASEGAVPLGLHLVALEDDVADERGGLHGGGVADDEGGLRAARGAAAPAVGPPGAGGPAAANGSGLVGGRHL